MDAERGPNSPIGREVGFHDLLDRSRQRRRSTKTARLQPSWMGAKDGAGPSKRKMDLLILGAGLLICLVGAGLMIFLLSSGRKGSACAPSPVNELVPRAPA